jgi:hypothetical protein
VTTETTISRPAPFVEDIGKDLSKQVLAQTTVPVVTTGLAGLGTMAQPTKQAFETAEQFKTRQGLFDAQRRAALGFEQRKQALSGLAPQVAGLDPLQQQAQRFCRKKTASSSRSINVCTSITTTTKTGCCNTWWTWIIEPSISSS